MEHRGCVGSSRLPHRGSRLVFFVALLVALSATPSLVRADDLAFAERLAEEGLFDLAEKVYARVATAEGVSPGDRARARLGRVGLAKRRAFDVAARDATPYEEVKRSFLDAARALRAFHETEQDTVRAAHGRLEVSSLWIGFAQWAVDLLEEPNIVEARVTNEHTLRADGKDAIARARACYETLLSEPKARIRTPVENLARYYHLYCAFYLGLLEPSCSPAAVDALRLAGNEIEPFIMDHDGQLLAVYAQDLYGVVWWKLALCEEDPAVRRALFDKSVEWFETCIFIDDQGPDYLRILARGAMHLAQVSLDACRLGGRDLLADADENLDGAFERHPGIRRLEDGLRALVEHSKVVYARGDIVRAAEIARDALTRARETDHHRIVRLANEQLRRVVLEGFDGSAQMQPSPAVLQRVADDLHLLGRYDDAIRAYRTVIASTPDTPEAFLDFQWHAWERIAYCYKRLGDRLGEALACDPIHEAWIIDRIPRGQAGVEDPNCARAGNDRRRAQFAMRELADRTGSRTFDRRYREIRDSFLHDYPAHQTSVSSRTWPHHWRSAMQLRKANREGWREEFRTAYRLLVLLSESRRARDSHRAWVYRIRARYELNELEEALAEARLAWESWNSAEARARAAKFPSTVAGRHPAQGMALYWESRILQELGRTEEAVAALEGWHDEYPELDSPYPELGYDLLVQAHLEAGQIEAAEAAWKSLLDEYPTYRRLGTVTFLLADHFNAQRAEIEKPLREVMRNFYDVRGDLRGAKKEVLRLDALLASLDLQLAEAMAVDEYWRRGGSPGDREEVERLEGRIADTTRRRHTWVGKRDDLLKRSEKLRAEKDALQQKLYEPLVKAAGIYFAWDQALKTAGKDRDPKNVKIFGDIFRGAGRLRSDVVEHWQVARMLYEDYLAFEAVRERPPGDRQMADAELHLGEIYAQLARHAAEPERRRDLARLAIDRLERSLSSLPANQRVVHGLLADELIVLGWTDSNGQRWRFPVPQSRRVADLRRSAQTLGTESGYPVLAFSTAAEEVAYRLALAEFQRSLKSIDDKLASRVLRSYPRGFDPALYRRIANVDPQFRLALAEAYALSRHVLNERRALNLARSLIDSPIGVEEDSAEWWEAARIEMRIYVRRTERALDSGLGATHAILWAERATEVFEKRVRLDPEFGESVLAGSCAWWRAVRAQLNEIRSRLELPRLEEPEPAAPAIPR